MRRRSTPLRALVIAASALLPLVAPAADPAPETTAATETETDGTATTRPGIWRRLWPAPDDAAATSADTDEDLTRSERRAQARQARVLTSTRQLSEVQARLRASAVGKDATTRAYLDLVDRGQATSAHLNALAIELAERGLLEDAVEYLRAALSTDREDANLWNNLGVLLRKMDKDDAAMAAFDRAVALDPNHALAHYNLGAVHDELGHYDEAIGEYRLALTLDPSLGDPTVNPQVVNNDRMLVVNLLLYQTEAGALSLPLVPIPGGTVGADTAASERPNGRPSRPAQPATAARPADGKR